MTEQPMGDEPELKMNLTMHPKSEMSLQPMVLGLKPQILVTLQMGEGDSLELDVQVYGIGTSKVDVMGVGNSLWLIAKAIEDKGEASYEEMEVKFSREEDTGADDDDVERAEPEDGRPA